MRKGITPVIAMILLILIVVALGGVFAAWTTRTWETMAEFGEESIETVTGRLEKSISIDGLYCEGAAGSDIVYIRNTGAADYPASEVSVYIDDQLEAAGDLTYGQATIAAGTVVDVTFDATDLSSGQEVKVTVSGNSATRKCS